LREFLRRKFFRFGFFEIISPKNFFTGIILLDREAIDNNSILS
jgi:hypothetical protein